MDTPVDDRAVNDPADDAPNSGEGWQAVAFTGGAALAFAVLAAMASFT
ncbi:hypothetical protein [Blastochloris viridis]|uniref:Uncharacterized protein n=1 Tax=Blastochloris viridis TaxID=1079 RepID=A0A0H5BFE6_BLAVI|nr:hypothetical protein [Blastochloris viridis]ALK09216.1 hypothetical protein BVIR_1432 [Blastochloris viridis]BAS00918.1 hypothetical protein BV133_3324 [Blastochloris viridis]CUU41879.1 hypothetical protein BVIRIDIS_08770 [Blastochloris viridis]